MRISSTPTPRQWDHLISLAFQVEIGNPLPKMQVAWLRSQIDCPMIAIVGVVNRGKSTLVNEILQQPISPENSRPETASVLGFARGARRQSLGMTNAGKRIRLPKSPSGFTKRVRRGSGLAVAMFARAKWLTPGVCLVDTPGLDEAESSFTESALVGATSAALELADAVVVVLGIPGVKGTDIKLLRDALKIHGSMRTLIVIKSNDSSVSKSDLEMWREELKLTQGYPLVVLLSDEDKSDLKKLQYFIRNVGNSTTETSNRKVFEVLSEFCHALAAAPVITVKRRLMKRLPVEVREIVRSKSPKAVRKREKEEQKLADRLRRERTVQLERKFGKLDTEWATQHQVLVAAANSALERTRSCRFQLNEVTKDNSRIFSQVGAFFAQEIQNRQQLALSQAQEAVRAADEICGQQSQQRDNHAKLRPKCNTFLKQHS